MKKLLADGSVKWKRDPFFTKKKVIFLVLIVLFIVVTKLTNWFTAFLLNAAFFCFWKGYQAEHSGVIGTESGTVKKRESPIAFKCLRSMTGIMGIMFLYFAGAEALKDANIAMNDPEIRSRVETAINIKKLQARGEKQNERWYTSKEQTPYTGWVKQWWANGQIKLLAEYKEGNIMTALAWRIGGEKCPHTNLVNGNGVAVFYNEVGTESFRKTYKAGKPDGLWTHWYKNGQKEYEWNFKDGKQDGLSTGWYENGQKKSEHTYKDGEIVED